MQAEDLYGLKHAPRQRYKKFNSFMIRITKKNGKNVKWILKYIRVTSKVCLCFGDGKNVSDGYIGATMPGDVN